MSPIDHHEAVATALSLTKHHVPTPEQVERIEMIRRAGQEFIAALLELGQPGADLTHAIREARSAQQWAIASIVVPPVALPRG